MQSRLALALLTLCLLKGVYSSYKCAEITGKLICSKEPIKAAHVQVLLMDADIDADDEMGRNVTDDEGNFFIHGCASDPLGGGEPDPYLVVKHQCNGFDERASFKNKLHLKNLPLKNAVGNVILDS